MFYQILQCLDPCLTPVRLSRIDIALQGFGPGSEQHSPCLAQTPGSPVRNIFAPLSIFLIACACVMIRISSLPGPGHILNKYNAQLLWQNPTCYFGKPNSAYAV